MRALLLAVLAAMSGCALASKSDPLTPRCYNPEASEGSDRVAVGPDIRGERVVPELRLGRVTGAPYLGERMVFRDTSHEVGYYDDRRWSEKPDAYLRRALARALFEQHGVRRLVAGAGPTLDVELTDFEEVRGPTPMARVKATFILQNGRTVIREQTLVIDRPIAGSNKPPTAEQTVGALSAALGELVDRMTTVILADLVAAGDRAQAGR